MLKRSSVIAISVLLFFGCSVGTVEGYINIVTGIAVQVATLAGLPQTEAAQIQTDMGIVETDFNNIAAANAAAKPGLANKVDADLQAAQADLQSFEATAKLGKSSVIVNVIDASIGIALTAIVELMSIEGAVSPAAPRSAARIVTHQTPEQLKARFNTIAAANNMKALK